MAVSVIFTLQRNAIKDTLWWTAVTLGVTQFWRTRPPQHPTLRYASTTLDTQVTTYIVLPLYLRMISPDQFLFCFAD